MGHPVGKVAALAGVTVRTLHHYDEIGLLSPSGRTSSGYRSYDDLAAGEAARQDWVRRLTALREAGGAPDGTEAADLAEEHRAMLARVMGECSYETQRRIGELYVTEPVQLGFLVREEEQRPGVGEFVRDAIVANIARRQ
jgi:MerR family transcriptional regulator, thiopeptide resistance regulator